MELKEITKKLQYNSPVILSFAAISFLALLLGYITGGTSDRLLFSVYRSSAASVFFYFRLVGHIFGHGDFSHFFNNFVIILLVGPMLEEKYGSKKLLFMILFTAIVTGMINIVFFSSGLLGASGIAFMMILLSSYTNFEQGKIPLTLICVVIAFLGKEVMNGLLTKDNISQLTHIIGGFCGGVFGFFLAGDYRRNGF